MDLTIRNGAFVPRIEQLPLTGKEIIVAFETMKLAVEVVVKIGNAIMDFARELGIIPDIKVDELGSRVIQALDKGIRPEDFATTEDWVNRLLQDDWGYDPKVGEQLSQIEKTFMGIGAIAAFLVDKFEQLPMKDFIMLASACPGLFTAGHIEGMAGLVLQAGESFDIVVRYLAGTDKTWQTVDKATDILMELEKSINPELDDDKAYDMVLSYSR